MLEMEERAKISECFASARNAASLQLVEGRAARSKQTKVQLAALAAAERDAATALKIELSLKDDAAATRAIARQTAYDS